jgi:hypothetical protein
MSLYDDGIDTYDEKIALELFPTEVKFLDGNAKIEYDSENSTIKFNSSNNNLELISDSNVDIYAGEGSRILTKVNDVSVFELQETFAEFQVPVTFNDGVSGIALDVLDDVNAGAPSDGDVLTWDDGAGEWVAAAPAGGGSIFGDYNDDNTDYPTVEDSPASYIHYLDIGTDNAYELNMNTSQFTLRLGNSTQTTYKAPRTVWLVLNDVYSGGTITFSLSQDNQTALAGTVTLRSGGSFPSTVGPTVGNGVTYIMLMSPDNYNWFYFSSDLT